MAVGYRCSSRPPLPPLDAHHHAHALGGRVATLVAGYGVPLAEGQRAATPATRGRGGDGGSAPRGGQARRRRHRAQDRAWARAPGAARRDSAAPRPMVAPGRARPTTARSTCSWPGWSRAPANWSRVCTTTPSSAAASWSASAACSPRRSPTWRSASRRSPRSTPRRCSTTSPRGTARAGAASPVDRRRAHPPVAVVVRPRDVGARRGGGRRQPDRDRARSAGGGRRPGRGGRVTALVAAPARRRSTPCSTRGVIVAGASSHPGKFGFVVLHNLLAHGYAGRSRPTATSAARGATRCSGCPARVDRGRARRCRRPRVRVHAGRAQRRPAAHLRRPRRAGGVRDDRRLRRDRRRRAGGGTRARRRRRGAGPAPRGPERPGRRVDPSALCAQMVAPYPPPGPIAVAASRATSSRASRTSPASPASASAARCRWATRRRSAWPTSSSGSPTTRRRDVDHLRRGHRRRPAAVRATAGGGERKPVVVVKGGRHAAGPAARRRVAHRRAGRRRPGVHRHVPAGGRHAPRGHGRRGVRGRRHARHPAAAGGPPHDRAHHRRRMGRGRGRRGHPVAATGCPSSRPTSARSSTRSSRRGGDGRTPIDLAAARPATPSPRCIELLAAPPEVARHRSTSASAIQSNQARLLRAGAFARPGRRAHRSYHERQDARYARVAAEVSAATGTPIVRATELAAQPTPTTPGPWTVRVGRLSLLRAVNAP